VLARIVYHSENHLGSSGGGMIADLNAIMDVANRNNERDGITGALLFDTLWFVQVLEGEREAISGALRRIMRDERHDNVTVMETRTVRERAFGNWWMGIAMLRGDNAPLFERHGIGPRLDPRFMTGEQVVGLARDLAGSTFARRLVATAA
jgi:hypothetical protein